MAQDRYANNTTAYEHPQESNLLNIHKTMQYNNSGQPVARVHVDGITLEGDVIVDTVSLSSSTLAALETITISNTSFAITNFPTTSTVYQGTIPWATTVTNWPALQYVNGTVYAVQSGTWSVGVTGNVTVDNFTSTVNIASMPAVSGTVAISSLPPVTGTVAISSLPEVEIKNDSGNPIPVSSNTSPNTPSNPLHVDVVASLVPLNQGKNWFFQVAQGLVAGHIPLFKAGYNPSVANNTEESIWAHSELYPWSAWGTGGTLSCVSASASDVGTLEIVGLRASDWTEVTETVTMTGVTPVVTTNSFIRVNNVHYSHTTSNVGEIHLNRNGTCVAHIDAGNGQGQMAQYTVPAGYTAYLLTGNANLGKGNDGTGKFRYRLYGSSFQTAMTFLLFQSTFNYTFEAPLALPEKTDLDVTLIASVSGTAVTCAYSMILIQNGL